MSFAYLLCVEVSCPVFSWLRTSVWLLLLGFCGVCSPPGNGVFPPSHRLLRLIPACRRVALIDIADQDTDDSGHRSKTHESFTGNGDETLVFCRRGTRHREQHRARRSAGGRLPVVASRGWAHGVGRAMFSSISGTGVRSAPSSLGPWWNASPGGHGTQCASHGALQWHCVALRGTT